MIRITEHAKGCILPVHAQPEAQSRDSRGICGVLKVAVTAPPEDGRANKALVELLAKELGLKRSQVILLSGQTGREKRFLIKDLNKRELESCLAAIVPG